MHSSDLVRRAALVKCEAFLGCGNKQAILVRRFLSLTFSGNVDFPRGTEAPKGEAATTNKFPVPLIRRMATKHSLCEQGELSLVAEDAWVRC